MTSVPYRLETTNDHLTSRAGLACVAQVMESLQLGKLVDHAFPAPGGNRGYRPSDYVSTFVMMLHEGGRCLDDVRHLKNELVLMNLLGFNSLPSSDALGDWLRRLGRGKVGLKALAQVNKPMMQRVINMLS